MTLAALAALLAGSAGARADTDIVRLIPDESAGWSLRNLVAPLRPGHYYSDRTIEVATTPPGAVVDLFYVRSGFQLRYEQATAPVEVVLPSRIKSTSKDSVTIRALLDGYQEEEVSVRVASDTERVLLELAPLANTLQAVSHRYFGGRSSLTFLTDEALSFRIQEARDGLSLVLTQTAASPQLDGALESVRDPLIESVAEQQLGEDLVVRVKLSAGAEESTQIRSRKSHDPLRELHAFAVDFVPEDRGSMVEKAQRALARIDTEDVTGCNAVFDEALRESLEDAALARALAPDGRFTDPYLRAAMKRLGEVSPEGDIRLVDGSRFRPESGIELTAAMTQAAQARGYLALLRAFVAGLEEEPYRRATLRGLIAPELGADAFARKLERAEARERRCRAPS